MRKKTNYHSLRRKITLGLLLPLVAVFAVTSYLRYTSYRSVLMENLELSSASTVEIVRGSLRYATLTNDFSAVQESLEDAVKHRGMQNLFLLDDEGRVVMSVGSRQVGEKLDIAYASQAGRDVILTDQQGRRVYRSVSLIENSNGQKFLVPEDRTVRALISDFPMAPIDAQLAAYRRSRLFLSTGSIIVILLIADAMMSRTVVSKLQELLRAVKQISSGDLDTRVAVGSYDEVAELAQAFNSMADGLKEKDILEQRVKERTKELQIQTEKLSALNAFAATVSQSLNLREVLRSALDEVLELMKVRACWIVLRNDHGEGLGPMVSRGLPEAVAVAQVQCAWNRSLQSEVLELGLPRILPYATEYPCPATEYFQDAGLPKVFPNAVEYPCPAAHYFRKEGLLFRACVPLKSKERILGVMTLIGNASDDIQELTEDSLEMLMAIGRQIGIAIENASLYEELHREEALRRQILERLITVQEEERKRIARELHDQTGQPLTSLIMTLKVLEEAGSLADVRGHVQELRDTVTQILEQVHDLALELRPSVLDDLGLMAALRHYFGECRYRYHLPVDFQVLRLEDQRLPPEMETALYRIVQEALTNIARHAQAQGVSVLLENRGTSVMLIVEDDGKGFDVAHVMGSRPHEKNLGLYGMRERAALLGGTLTIESTPGAGTTVFVEIPLGRGEGGYDQNSPAAC